MKYVAEKVYGFDVIYGDTISIFVTNVKGEPDINKFAHNESTKYLVFAVI
jgi:hypothetical protein